MNNLTGRKFIVGHAYGQPRVEEMLDNGGYRETSPRLTMGQLRVWMHAFIDGIDAGRDSLRQQIADLGYPSQEDDSDESVEDVA